MTRISYIYYFNNLIELCNIHSSTHPLRNVGNGKLRLAFTLVELLVVITILAILGTIAFISLNNFSASARDTKRLSDVRSLYTKLTLENTKGTKYEDLVNVGSTSSMLINGETRVVAQGVVNFGAIRENRDNFLDPSTNTDYPVAFHEAGLIASLSTEARDPSILEIATINEEKNKAVVVGNYSLQIEGDTPGLILSGGDNPKIITNDSGNLPYDIGNGNGKNTDESAIEIYGDEGETEIRACEKWITDNIPADKGEWIWVPAREEYFIDDGYPEGTKMIDDYYKREITYNDVKYICKGFAVAKYEMSYKNPMEPNTSDNTATVPRVDRNTVTYTSNIDNGGIVSIADRFPIAKITQSQAIGACNSVGEGIHLITNNERMTVARNIEQQKDNWSGKSVGNGYISNSLSNDAVHGCIAMNDVNGNNVIGTPDKAMRTNDIYPELTRNRISKTGIAIGLTDTVDCNTKRQHKLSTGNTIWDLAGNAREHVNKGNSPEDSLVYDSDIYHGNLACGNTTAEGWYSYSGNDGKEECIFTKDYSYSNMGPLTPDLNANNGIGRIWSRIEATQTTNSNNIFQRGSCAVDGVTAGIFTLILDNISISENGYGENGYLGFRCSL